MRGVVVERRSDRGRKSAREREMECDVSQSVIQGVIHGPDAQINAILRRDCEGEE